MSKKFHEEVPAEEAVTEGFNPEAVDGDGDGLVQDGTQFERPVEEALVANAEAPAPAPVYVPYNLLDEVQFLVRYYLSDGRVFREFCTTDEQAVTYKEIYSAAAEEKGLTLVRAEKVA